MLPRSSFRTEPPISQPTAELPSAERIGNVILHPMLCHLPGDSLHLLGGSKVSPLASICYNSKGPPSAPKRPLLQMRRRLTSPSAHLCLQNPPQMLLLRVLLNKLHAHKSWSLRICFLGNLDILRILCLHSKDQLLSLFPIL